MEILHKLPFKNEQTIVALGNFDGIHLGHQKLIRGVVAEAKNRNHSSVVLTFDPHPEKVLNPRSNLKSLIPKNKKSELTAELGVDKLIYLPFTMQLAQLTPEEFARKVLKEALDAQTVFVGFNYTFGRKASGNTKTLTVLGKELGFDLQVIPPVRVNGEVVSSTIIRKALEQGEVEQAKQLLGYWPVLSGYVVSGQQKGRTIGFPTANLQIDDDILIPKNGVYASLVRFKNKYYYAMTNIGIKPTIDHNLPLTIEINIFDFNQDIYGQELEVSLCKRLRDEKKFSSLQALTTQLRTDYANTLQILNAIEDITTHISCNC